MLENNMNENPINYSPTKLIDEVSDSEYYIGISDNGNTKSASTWEIQKCIKTGTIWEFLYPDGDQGFSYVWNDRTSYTYS